MSGGHNRIGQGPKDGVEQPVATATESNDDCREHTKLRDRGPVRLPKGVTVSPLDYLLQARGQQQ